MSVDMVRVGSPFFGTHLTTYTNGSPTKTINNKISDTSLKFSPLKQNHEFFNPEFVTQSCKREQSQNRPSDSLKDDNQDAFSFNNEEDQSRQQHELNDSFSRDVQASKAVGAKNNESFSSQGHYEDAKRQALPLITNQAKTMIAQQIN